MKSHQGRIVVAMLATLAIQYLVPLPVYGVLEAVGLVELPEGGSPAQFMLSVLVIKIGVAFAFVLLFRLAGLEAGGSWWPYAAIWWVMFALIEVGQAIGPGYSVWEAAGGIVAEAIYFPLSCAAVARLLRDSDGRPV